MPIWMRLFKLKMHYLSARCFAMVFSDLDYLKKTNKYISLEEWQKYKLYV